MSLGLLVMILAQLVIFVVFCNRYIFGSMLKRLAGRSLDHIDPNYEPHVAVVIPLFNEGKTIYDTVLSLLGQDYPAEKLSIIVVDDCSTDDSFAWAQQAAIGRPNVTVLQNPQNMGKRLSINNAVRMTEAEIIVSVDSDVVVKNDAVRRLVQRFTEPEIAAVGGRVLVANRNENMLTRMQVIKYFYGYEYLKNVERTFKSVLCLSGCLTAYRRHVLIELEPILANRNLWGISLKYGEDRFLTRQIIKAGYKTTLALDAHCYTKVPNTFSKYFAQQLRWRRSNIVDYLGGMSHVWKLHPAVALHYFALAAMLFLYPVVLYNSVVNQFFFPLAVAHLGLLMFFALLYRFETRHWPDEERVGSLNFLMMAVVMPVTYMVLTPVALLTLDSGSWETRDHGRVLNQVSG